MRHNGVILVPVELSEASREALCYALQLARHYEARLVLLHVVEAVPAVWTAGTSSAPSAAAESRPSLEQRFEAWLEGEETEGVELEKRIEQGTPGATIARVARDLGADLVVLLTQGITGLQAWFLGGIAHRVLRSVRCPVVSIKPQAPRPGLMRLWEGLQRLGSGEPEPEEGATSGPRFPPTTILHPTDFSEASGPATNLAARLAGATSARLVVLHVVARSPAASEDGPDGSDGTTDPATALDHVRWQAEAWGAGMVTTILCEGHAWSQILQKVGECGADLIVMGSEGIGGISVVSVGSTAAKVVRQARCPVVTLRADTSLQKIDEAFRKVNASLSVATLRMADDDDAGGDLFGQLFGERGAEHFLGFYTQKGFTHALEEYGILQMLRDKGFERLQVSFDLSDAFEHTFRVHFDDTQDRDHLLIEATLRPGTVELPPSDPPDGPRTFPVLVVRWLCLQNPRGGFSARRPPMPDQTYPGLGMGREVLELLVLIAERLGKAGLVNCPMQFHNARFYHPMFRFLDPAVEGRFAALLRDTSDVTLADASWAMHKGCVDDCKRGTPAKWEGHEQVFPIAAELRRHFDSTAYRRESWAVASFEQFAIDWDRYVQRLGMAPDDPVPPRRD
ncbi:MAG: universal stress protein [Polyangiaceae bacterium]|jgi:nucleotide-binding universal stress UspA family protein|nr:universal stress protein [Polyangiaceae bacterium]